MGKDIATRMFVVILFYNSKILPCKCPRVKSYLQLNDKAVHAIKTEDRKEYSVKQEQLSAVLSGKDVKHRMCTM